MTQLMLLLQLTLAVLLLLWQPTSGRSYYNHDVFEVSGSPASSNSRGTFASPNFPHALPIESESTYAFRVFHAHGSDTFCLWFKELSLFTLEKSSASETTIRLYDGVRNLLLVYAGNGSLLRPKDDIDQVVIRKPDHLLSGPLCLFTPYVETSYLLLVRNVQFFRNSRDRVTRFFAEYAAVDSNSLEPKDNSSRDDSNAGLHRCLDGTSIAADKRCNSAKDCGRGQYRTDFFRDVSSDESYEHARCSSSNSFGTNFVLGQASAHRLTRGLVIDCTTDHSGHYPPSDRRDCALLVPRRPADVSENLPILQLSGLEPTTNLQPACYRFYWQSTEFPSPDEALTLVRNGRALLRLDGRPATATDIWHLVEVQVDPRERGLDWIDGYSLRPGHVTGSGPRHWLDDLSAEPAPCNLSTYETRMPVVCSFEWSTCGWESSMLVVTDRSVANAYRVSFTDHTSDSLSGRPVPPEPQRVLQLLPGVNNTGRLVSRRRLRYFLGRNWCLGIWFYGLGDHGRSVRLDAVVQIRALNPQPRIQMTATAPANQWHLMTSSLFEQYVNVGAFRLNVSLQAQRHNQLWLVLLDDISITEGDCDGYVGVRNGTVQCGSLEWRCLIRPQCVPLGHRCDGFFHCQDGSDEMSCYTASDSYWSLILRVTIGVVVIIGAFVLLSICLRMRSARRLRSEAAARTDRPSSVTDGRLPADLRSDRRRHRRPDMPPSYSDVAGGAPNAGFSVDEEPPKYDQVVAMLQQQEEQQQQRQQQEQHSASQGQLN